MDRIDLSAESFKGIIEKYLSKKLNREIIISCEPSPGYYWSSASVTVSYTIYEDRYGYPISRKRTLTNEDILCILQDVFYEDQIESIFYSVIEADRSDESTYFSVTLNVKEKELLIDNNEFVKELMKKIER